MKHLKIISLILAALLIFSGCSAILPEREIGGDRRTWRGYSQDLSLNSRQSVTFSRFTSELDPECTGFAMYDAQVGARIGTILLSREDSARLPGSIDFRAEDRDGDGTAEIGIPLEDGTVIWFRFGFADTWQENILEETDRSAPEKSDAGA